MEAPSFIGHIPRKDTPVHIVGAGFAGLSCAYYLKKNNIPFTLYEKGPATGGMLSTTQTPYGPAEAAANGFIWCREIAEMAETLNISLLPPNASSRKRFLVRDGQLRTMPLSIWELLKTLKRAYSAPYKACDTLHDFGMHYLGETATRQVLAPGMAGIYGAPLQDLSFAGTIPAIWRVQQQSGSLLMNLRRYLKEQKKIDPVTFKGTWSVEGGIQTLTDAMTEYVKEHVSYTEIRGLSDLPAGEQVILCTPAHAAKGIFSAAPSISDLLGKTEYLPLVTATLFFGENSFDKLPKGFGCLLPREEGSASRGILFNHDIFEGKVNDPAAYSLTFILHADRLPNGVDSGDEDILWACYTDADRLLGRIQPAIHSHIVRWPQALPVYSLAHMDILQKLGAELQQNFPYVSLFGNYTGQISLRGMVKSASQVFNN